MTSAARSKKACPRCRRAFDADAAFCPSDGAALEPRDDAGSDIDPYIGMVIHDDIQIKSVAGAGAMGRVYRAHQRGVDRDVAVKILHRELSGNTALVQRFHREGKIASKLQHPHVVEVYFAGQLADGALYIAMEFLDGMSLATATTVAGGSMPLERALPIVLQICDAVGEGHARGIVHRDLKPENVMLVRRAGTRDWVKVLDFGIAKLSLGEQSMETAAGLIFGTARYISPEGAQGATVGPPGDVYSIAVILYQLLAGRTPFEAERPVGLLIKHIHDSPPPLWSWPAAANVPKPIARVIMDNLAKDPSLRAPNARALGGALASAAREARVSIPDVGAAARMSAPPEADALADTTADEALPRELSTQPPLTRTHASTTAGAPAPPRRTAAVLVLLAFLLGGALTALAMRYVSDRRESERTALIQRARGALARGRYVEPPGNNVRDLVRVGLAKWPDDADLVKVQSDAAHEIVTRAMAARSGGDVNGAHELAETAHELDPTDGTARMLLAHYDDELAALAEDAGGDLGGARVTLEVPLGATHPGGRAELVARVIVSSKRHEVTGATFLVTGPGLADDGLIVPATGERTFRGSFAPPREGNYEIVFEANVGGASVRANRRLTVTR